MINSTANPVFELPGGGTIRYAAAIGALPAALAWPTSITDPGFAMRIAGGTTLTYPGVWSNIRFQDGSALYSSLLIGELRADYYVPHVVTALKQSGTQPVVLGVEAAFRSFGLLPPCIQEFPIPSGLITYDEVKGALTWPTRLSAIDASRFALAYIGVIASADATLTLRRVQCLDPSVIREIVADSATEEVARNIDSALRHFYLVR